MKTYNISCCAECPALKKQKNGECFCSKCEKVIIYDDLSPISPALIGFPDWCPLENVKSAGEGCKDYNKVVQKIIRILGDHHYSEKVVSEAAYYLNSVFDGNEKEAV